MKSRILLSAITAGILTSCAFGGIEGINYESKDGQTWIDCTGDACKEKYQTTSNPDSGDANGKTINITDFYDNAKSYTIYYGGYSKNGDANGNEIKIINSKFVQNGSIYGGVSDKGSANGNTIIVENVQENMMTAIFGGQAINGTANDNVILISGNDATMSSVILASAKVLNNNKLFYMAII